MTTNKHTKKNHGTRKTRRTMKDTTTVFGTTMATILEKLMKDRGYGRERATMALLHEITNICHATTTTTNAMDESHLLTLMRLYGISDVEAIKVHAVSSSLKALQAQKSLSFEQAVQYVLQKLKTCTFDQYDTTNSSSNVITQSINKIKNKPKSIPHATTVAKSTKAPQHRDSSKGHIHQPTEPRVVVSSIKPLESTTLSRPSATTNTKKQSSPKNKKTAASTSRRREDSTTTTTSTPNRDRADSVRDQVESKLAGDNNNNNKHKTTKRDGSSSVVPSSASSSVRVLKRTRTADDETTTTTKRVRRNSTE